MYYVSYARCFRPVDFSILDVIRLADQVLLQLTYFCIEVFEQFAHVTLYVISQCHLCGVMVRWFEMKIKYVHAEGVYYEKPD